MQDYSMSGTKLAKIMRIAQQQVKRTPYFVSIFVGSIAGNSCMGQKSEENPRIHFLTKSYARIQILTKSYARIQILTKSYARIKIDSRRMLRTSSASDCTSNLVCAYDLPDKHAMAMVMFAHR